MSVITDPARVAAVEASVRRALESDAWRAKIPPEASDVQAFHKVEPDYRDGWVYVEVYLECRRGGILTWVVDGDHYGVSESPDQIAERVAARALDLPLAILRYPDLPAREALGRLRGDLLVDVLCGED